MSVNSGSDRVYKSIFESSLEAILLTTLDGTILAANPKVQQILGYSNEELLKLSIYAIVDTGETKLNFIFEKSGIADKSSREITIIQKNGEKFNALISSNNFRDEEGNELVSVVIKEIKEIKKLELALEDSEKQFHKLFENMIDGYAYCKMLFDEKGRPIDWIYLEVNRAFEQLTGLKNVKDRRVTEVIPQLKKLKPDLFEIYRRVILTGITESFELYINPLKIWLHISVYKSGGDQFVTVFKNITHRKEAEKELIESKNRLFDIIDFLPDPTFAINSRGEVIAWNRAIEAITGFRAEDMLGKGNYEYALPIYGIRRPILIDLVTDPNKVIEKQYSKIKRWEDGIYGQTNAPLKGINRILWGKAVPLYNDKGIITGAIEVIRDITESKKAEKEVIDSLHEKELLIKEIHHRVKNNMQIVSSLLNLQTNYVDEKETVDVLKESQNRVRSMAMIHEELYRSGDLTHINFVNYVQNLIQKLLYAYNIDATIIKPILKIENINLNMETAVPCGLIISELVSNSLKYAFPNGMAGEIYISLKSKEDKFELVIRDNGIGLPENFDFNKLDSLGLLLVKNLTDQIDGDLTINVTTGTEFIINFEELEYKTRI
ncbi:PAS domain S-box protein [Methanobacterium sp. SMA-27]|uniref:PAS domain-containing sensor histidine kinase n=1 Tax=Methanobacterium sp. SMA-27 TaxID=1495336 RepID=UPI000694BD50|nr:PAS domain S-box protein [Methanobacterium sp. SMA-27]